MAAVESEKKWRFILLLVVLKVCTSDSVCAVVSNKREIVERIARRQNSDLYYFINSNGSHLACSNGSQTTYVINENQCVNEQELFSGKLSREFLIISLAYYYFYFSMQ